MMVAMGGSMAICNAEITVLDYESTGSLRNFQNEPWQIGMVSLRNGKVDPGTMYESLLRIDINRPFNPHAPGRHDLLREEMAEAPTLRGLWPRIKTRLTEYPLAAHNVATERKFTVGSAPMHRFGPWIDTLKVARKAWPGQPSYALEDLVAALDLKQRIITLCPDREAHDALYDAVAAAVLLEHLFAQPGWGNVTVGELAAI